MPYKFSVKKQSILRPLPSFNNKEAINVRYPLLIPHATAHIYWDGAELVYDVEEPLLEQEDADRIELLKFNLTEKFQFLENVEKNDFMDVLEKAVKEVLKELNLDKNIDEKKYNKFMYYIYRDFFGCNQIEPLLHDLYIEDIECNGVNEPVYIVHRLYENMKTSVIFHEVEELRDFVEKLAQKSGKYVSYAQPLLDSSLPDGSRINATYSDDVTTRGPSFTIRRFNKEPLTPIDLINNGTASADVFAYLWLILQYKFNLMIIGETSSGKTTLLNSVADFIPDEARLCSIEDTRELNLVHSNWLPSVARTGVRSDFGDVTLFDLLKESFRQNPDYVIVGEARGKEAYVMFQGMASGHPTLSTFHAEDMNRLLRRLENPPINLPDTLLEVLDVVVKVTHIKTSESNYRQITEVDEVYGVEKEKNLKKKAFIKFVPSESDYKVDKASYMIDKISELNNLSREEIFAELDKRSLLLQKMVKHGVKGYKDFASIINRYYKTPENVLKEWGVQVNAEKNSGRKASRKE